MKTCSISLYHKREVRTKRSSSSRLANGGGTAVAKSVVFLLAMICLLPPASLTAQTPWERVNGYSPYGPLNRLATTRDGRVYLSTVYNLFRLNEDWSAWEERRLPGHSVSAMLADTAYPGGMVLAEDGIAVFHTSDGGERWQPQGTRVGNFAQRLFDGGKRTFFLSGHPDRLMRFRQGWGVVEHVGNGLEYDVSYRNMGLVARDPEHVIIYTKDGATYRSSDNGYSWERDDAGAFGVCFQDGYTDGKTIWLAASLNGVYRRRKGETQWRQISNGLGLDGEASSRALRILRGHDGNLLVLTIAGFFTSADEGDSWQPTGTIALPWNRVRETHHAGDGRYVFLRGGDSVYVSTDSLQSCRLVRGGLDLGAVNDIVFHGGKVFLLGEEYVHRSDNASTSPAMAWHRYMRGMEGRRPRSMVSLLDQELLAFDTQGTVYRYDSLDDDWDYWSSGLLGLDISASFAVSPTTLFVGTGQGAVYRSIDAGRSWTRMFTFPNASPVRCFLAVAGNRVFAGSDGEGLYRSDDGGGSWQYSGTGLTHASVSALCQWKNGDLYAATLGGGICYSIDNGHTWQQQGNEYSRARVTDVQARGDAIFAAMYGVGVFATANRGATWKPMSPDLADQRITALRVAPRDYLWSVVDNRQIWRTSYFVVLSSETVAQPATPFLGGVHPDPLRGVASFAYGIDRAATVRIDLFDVLGRQRATIVNAAHAPGRFTATIDATALPTGSYLLRMDADGARTQRLLRVVR